jgi:hypothetical protein
VVAQQHEVLRSEVFLQARAFVVVERDPFVIMIGEIEDDALRGLVERQQTALDARDGRAVGGVNVHNAGRVVTHFVDGGVNRETRRIDGVGRRRNGIAVATDFDEARRGDFVEGQAIRVDEKFIFDARQARRNMREDQIVPLMQGDKAVTGRQIDTNRPFGVRHRLRCCPFFCRYYCHDFLPVMLGKPRLWQARPALVSASKLGSPGKPHKRKPRRRCAKTEPNDFPRRRSYVRSK